MYLSKYFLGVTILLVVQHAMCQSVIHPTGIYAFSDSMDAAIDNNIYTLDYVDGVVLRYNWSTLEPAKGNFNFTPVIDEINKARFYHKKVCLAVAAGRGTPAWLYNEGVPKLDFVEIPHRGDADKAISFSMCPPWNSTFLSYYKNFIATLQAALALDTAVYNNIAQIKICGINRYTEELVLPTEDNVTNGTDTSTNATAIWLNAGYRPFYVYDAFAKIVRHYRTVFKNKALNIPFIPDPYSLPLIGNAGQIINKNKQSIVEQMLDKSVTICGQRLMCQWNAFAKEFVPPVLDSCMQSGAAGGLQISFRNYGKPDWSKNDSLKLLFDFAFAKNINYMELHEPTLTVLDDASRYGYYLFHQRDGSYTNDVIIPELITNAPNPFTEFTYVTLKAVSPRKPIMKLFDARGNFLREIYPVKTDEYEYLYFIDGRKMPAGTYTVYVKVREHQLGAKIMRASN